MADAGKPAAKASVPRTPSFGSSTGIPSLAAARAALAGSTASAARSSPGTPSSRSTVASAPQSSAPSVSSPASASPSSIPKRTTVVSLAQRKEELAAKLEARKQALAASPGAAATTSTRTATGTSVAASSSTATSVRKVSIPSSIPGPAPTSTTTSPAPNSLAAARKALAHTTPTTGLRTPSFKSSTSSTPTKFDPPKSPAQRSTASSSRSSTPSPTPGPVSKSHTKTTPPSSSPGATPIRSSDRGPSASTSPLPSRLYPSSTATSPASEQDYARQLQQRLLVKERDVVLLEGRLTKQREEFAEQLAQAEAATTTAQTATADLQKKCQELQEKLDASHTERKGKDAAVKSMEARLSDTERQLVELQEMVESLTVDKELAEEKSDGLAQEVENLKLHVEELETDKELLMQERETNAARFESIGALPEASASARGASYEYEVKSLQGHNERLKEALQKLHEMSQADKQGLNSRIKELEKELLAIPALEEKARKYAEALVQLETRESEIEELKESLDLAQQAAETAEELVEKNAKLEEEVATLKATVDDLESLKEVTEEMEDHHKETLRQLQQEADSKDIALQEATVKIQMLQTDVSDAERNIEQLRDRLRSLQATNQALQEKEQAITTQSEEVTIRSREMHHRNLELEAQSIRAASNAIEVALAKLSVENATLNVTYMQAFLPDDVLKMEHEPFQCLLSCLRVSGKADLLAKQLALRFPYIGSPTDGRPAVSHSATVHALQVRKAVWRCAWASRRLWSAIESCDEDTYARLGRISRDFTPVDRQLDRISHLLQKDILNPSLPLDDFFENVNRMEAAIESVFNNTGIDHSEEAEPHSQLHVVPWLLVEEAARKTSLECETATLALHKITLKGSGSDFDDEPTKRSFVDQQTEADAGLDEEATRMTSQLETTLNKVFEDCRRILRGVSDRKLSDTIDPILDSLSKADSSLKTVTTGLSAVGGVVVDIVAQALLDCGPAANFVHTAMEKLISGHYDVAPSSEKEKEKPSGPSAITVRAFSQRAARIRKEMADSLRVRDELEQAVHESEERLKAIMIRDKELEDAAVKYAKLQHRFDTVLPKAELCEKVQTEYTQIQEALEQARKDVDEQKQRAEQLNSLIEKHQQQQQQQNQISAPPTTSGYSTPREERALLRASPTIPLDSAIDGMAPSLRAAVQHLNKKIARLTKNDFSKTMKDLTPLAIGPSRVSSSRPRLVTTEEGGTVSLVAPGEDALKPILAALQKVSGTLQESRLLACRATIVSLKEQQPPPSLPPTATAPPPPPHTKTRPAITKPSPASVNTPRDLQDQAAAVLGRAQAVLIERMPSGTAPSCFGSFPAVPATEALSSARNPKLIGRVTVPSDQVLDIPHLPNNLHVGKEHALLTVDELRYIHDLFVR